MFVVDGSPDRSYEILRDSLPMQRFASQLILLSKNFGSFMAIRTGLQHGKGRTFAVMAADLQEPPSLVLTMNRVLNTEPVDVVVGVRESRQDPFLSKLASKTFWVCTSDTLFRKCRPAALTCSAAIWSFATTC